MHDVSHGRTVRYIVDQLHLLLPIEHDCTSGPRPGTRKNVLLLLHLGRVNKIALVLDRTEGSSRLAANRSRYRTTSFFYQADDLQITAAVVSLPLICNGPH